MSTEPVVYVFKVKQDDLKWEETPIYTLQHLAPDDTAGPGALAQKIANATRKEVRWNERGSLQGHYVQPEAK